MHQLDDNFLQQVGLGQLPPAEKNKMLDLIYSKLEEYVGKTLASQMTDQQLDEFETLLPAESDTDQIKSQKQDQALNWLETNFPHYKQVVAEQLEILKAEIKAQAPAILEATMSELKADQA